MENIINFYKDKEVFMVGALDSLGVPYTLDNTEMKSYIELVADALSQHGIHLTYFNMSSLGRNKTWELQRILKHDYSIGEYNRWNQYASLYVISGQREEESWPFPTNPNFVEEFYKDIPHSDIRITTQLQTIENPIFLYSCGGMNIRQYLKVNSEMDFEDVKVCFKEVVFRAFHHIRQTKQDIRNVIEDILSLNPNMEIYVLGVYAMLDEQIFRDLAFPFVFWYNAELKKIISSYENVHYIDIVKVKDMVAKKDMHPTLEGQKYIAKQLIKKMDDVCFKKNNSFKVE